MVQTAPCESECLKIVCECLRTKDQYNRISLPLPRGGKVGLPATPCGPPLKGGRFIKQKIRTVRMAMRKEERKELDEERVTCRRLLDRREERCHLPQNRFPYLH